MFKKTRQRARVYRKTFRRGALLSLFGLMIMDANSNTRREAVSETAHGYLAVGVLAGVLSCFGAFTFGRFQRRSAQAA